MDNRSAEWLIRHLLRRPANLIDAARGTPLQFLKHLATFTGSPVASALISEARMRLTPVRRVHSNRSDSPSAESVLRLFIALLAISAVLIFNDAKQSLAQSRSITEADCFEATPEHPGPQDIARMGAALNNLWKLKVRLFVCPNRLEGIAYATSDGTVHFHNAQEVTLLPTRKQQTFAGWLLLAHEWGHQVQYSTYPLDELGKVSKNDPPVFELQADCLAGYALGTLVAQGADIPFAMNVVTWKLGDYGGAGSHGNPMQRQAAFSRGLAGTGYPANLTVGAAPEPLRQGWQSACDPTLFPSRNPRKGRDLEEMDFTNEKPTLKPPTLTSRSKMRSLYRSAASVAHAARCTARHGVSATETVR